jgi:hypothetical protein
VSHALAIRHAFHSGAEVYDFMEHIATEIFDAIYDSVSTKQNLAQLGTELRAEMAQLELRLEQRIDRVVIRLGTLIVAWLAPG